MVSHGEKQNVSADELLQALADGLDIHLNQCTITGALDINRFFDAGGKFQTEKLALRQLQDRKTLTWSQSIIFDKCTFEENVVFSGPWSEPDSITVEFKRRVIFNSSVFKGQARFRNAVFCDTAGFDGCTFDGVVTFKNATFQQDAEFRTVTFNGFAMFDKSAFKSSARFESTHFVKGANFSGVKFLGKTGFGGVYSSSRAVPAYDSIFFARSRYGDDESFWRFVKQSAQEGGYYQLAGECFYSERCARLRQKSRGQDYDALSLLKKLRRLIWSVRLLPELVLGRLLFGYGEKPIRVLVASALIIVLCAFFYAQPGALVYREGIIEPSFFQGLYFSTITFTTLGYGDFFPSAHGFCRQLAMAEAAAGGCLMALFVVCLAKRFSRG